MPAINPTGNVLTAGNDQSQNGGTLSVVGVAAGTTPGTSVGNVTGTYGFLTLNSTGNYTYTINESNLTVKALNQGSPPLQDVFTYTAQDSVGNLTASNTLTITINGTDDAPVVANPLSNQTGAVTQPFSFTVPANTFSDVDDPTLTLSASLANNNPLPSWLTFDPTTGTFSGAPPVGSNGTLALQVTATDSGRLAALEDFRAKMNREDIVIRFYEDFLAAYKPQMRERRGVYYTPEPVVSYSGLQTHEGQ